MKFCYYCGASADTLDHTIPFSFYSKLPIRKGTKSRYEDFVPVVDCCSECNGTLHNKLIIDVRARASLIRERYIKKYKKILNLVSWSDKDLNELSKSLRSYIIKDQILQEILKERLDHLEMIANLTEDPFLEEKKAIGYA